MLIHPWDAPTSDDQWREWLRHDHDFGQLIAPGTGRELPVVVPTHFTYRHENGQDLVLLHLARPNPVWTALTENPRALLTVVGDYTYIRSHWNGDPERGVPTFYYATVQLECDARILDDPHDKAELLTRQLDHFEPGSARCPVSHTEDPDRRLLPGIRGIELTVTAARAKFKYGGNKTDDVRERIAAELATRDDQHDVAVRAHLLRPR
ncbi:FMN-binding negative transcriptional regulator [Allokutzneria oryzae]|uniref:FMN-binding negative transcriptional regulator n=1 Tax=Allokutzneria oryzae TaxID=1378989 RepID=A0ABV5ZV48_9PSEU